GGAEAVVAARRHAAGAAARAHGAGQFGVTHEREGAEPVLARRARVARLAEVAGRDRQVAAEIVRRARVADLELSEIVDGGAAGERDRERERDQRRAHQKLTCSPPPAGARRAAARGGRLSSTINSTTPVASAASPTPSS